MISNKAVGSMTLVILVVASVPGFAEEQTAVDLYGRGVHAYFAGNYDAAITLLSDSIKKNDGDPRAYFFRGLAMASRNGLDAGAADMAKGADVEVNRKDKQLYDVNGALQRVQGTLRLALEKQRSAARTAAAEKKKKQDRIKYEEMRRREDIVLFKPDLPIKKIDLELPKVDLGGQNPFVTGVAFSGGKEVESAPPPPVVPADRTMIQPAGAGGEDPFPDLPKPKGDPENPFGDMAPKENPFGDTTPEEPPKPKPKPPGDGTNPFGDDMGKVAPDDPIFDENVRPELPPGMNVGGNIMDLLGKTLSGKATESPDRDPFGPDEPTPPPKSEPSVDDTGTEKKAEPGTNPFK